MRIPQRRRLRWSGSVVKAAGLQKCPGRRQASFVCGGRSPPGFRKCSVSGKGHGRVNQSCRTVGGLCVDFAIKTIHAARFLDASKSAEGSLSYEFAKPIEMSRLGYVRRSSVKSSLDE